MDIHLKRQTQAQKQAFTGPCIHRSSQTFTQTLLESYSFHSFYNSVEEQKNIAHSLLEMFSHFCCSSPRPGFEVELLASILNSSPAPIMYIERGAGNSARDQHSTDYYGKEAAEAWLGQA